jgi:hypothetical protein
MVDNMMVKVLKLLGSPISKYHYESHKIDAIGSYEGEKNLNVKIISSVKLHTYTQICEISFFL